MKLTLGFSPCPNDTFIFDALVNGLIDTDGLSFDVVMEDVETLNRWALEEKLDVTKLSYGVLPAVMDNYRMLDSGSALGRGVGPLLVEGPERSPLTVEDQVVAIPGMHTTAHLLFSLAYPNARKKHFLRYDEIEDFVLRGAGLGVIIHENRFTYRQKGLHKLRDLGEHWENETGVPVPLGGIAIRRNIDQSVARRLNTLIRNSLVFAYDRYPVLSDFIRQHAQEMDEDVMRRHIDLYVNEYTLGLGEEGRSAVNKFLSVYRELNETEESRMSLFVESD